MLDNTDLPLESRCFDQNKMFQEKQICAMIKQIWGAF